MHPKGNTMFASIFRKLGLRRCFSFWMFHNWSSMCATDTAQKMKFSIKDFFSKCDQICSFLRNWSNLLKKSLMESFIFLRSDTILSYLLRGSSWRPSDLNAKCRVMIYINCCNTNTHPNWAYEKSIGSETKRSKGASQIYSFLGIVSKLLYLFCIY